MKLYDKKQLCDTLNSFVITELVHHNRQIRFMLYTRAHSDAM